VVGELDLPIELIPFALPAPHRAAMNTAAIGNNLEWQKLSLLGGESGGEK